MENRKSSLQSSAHFLAALTGCMLLLAGTAGAHTAIAPGENARHAGVISHSIEGQLQHTFRKIRHLVGFFLDKDQVLSEDRPQAIRPAVICTAHSSHYHSVFSRQVRHLRNREIRTWLLRV